MKSPQTRRRFFSNATALAASPFAFQFVPSRVFGANDRIRVGGIGINGKGHQDVLGAHEAGAEIAALCDVVDPKHKELLRKKKDMHTERFKDAKFYVDYREMIANADIDAVTISTPDHHHAHAAIPAMRKGMHVYCQKPMSHSIWEARRMTEIAAETGVMTQMGNQAHAGEPIRRAVELIRTGIIGKVTEVHTWTNRPIWPQGMNAWPKGQAVPDGLNWDLWLGPSPEREYHPDLMPFKWRGWWDYGTGALGDMGCHIMDMPYWALDLGAPTMVEATQSGNTQIAGPNKSVVTYHFAGKGDQPPVLFKWYDGGEMPHDDVVNFNLPTLEHITRRFDMVLVGDAGKMAFGRNRQDWIVLPENEDYKEPPKFIARVPGGKADDTRGMASGGPYVEWIESIKSGVPALSNFHQAGPFTEVVLLGNLAIRLGKKIEWDSKNLVAKNSKEANDMIRRTYRKGWELS